MQEIYELADALRQLNKSNGYQDLALALAKAKDQLDAVAKAKSALQEAYDNLRQRVIPSKMEEEGLSTITVAGVGRMTITAQLQVSVRPEFKIQLKQWLVDNGHAELVTETINASTLKAWYKEQLMNGEELPDDMLNIYGFDQVSLTKK